MKKIISMLVLVLVCMTASAQLPSIHIKNTKGKPVDTSKLNNGGKPFAICFFATWCKPCNRELKAIHEVYPDWQDETGMKIFAVSVDRAQDAQKVKPFIDAEGWEYDVLLDTNSEFLHALGSQTVPFTVVCDATGKIQFTHNGYQEGGEKKIIQEIKALLKKKK